MDRGGHRASRGRLSPSSPLIGVALVGGATLCWSTTGLTTRLVAADAWTIILWRGLSGGLAILAVGTALRGRRAALASLRAMGWAGAGVAFCSTAGTILYITALKLSSVAHVAIIYATVPFLAATLGWLATREAPGASTVLASLAAAGGVLLMVGGTAGEGDALGDALALLMTLAYAVMIVILRRNAAVPLVPAAGLAALGCAAAAFPFAGPADPATVAALLLCGLVQNGLADTLFTRGAQAVPPSRTALIGTLEGPLAPLWVWLALGEAPAAATLAGGSVVLAAVVGNVALGERRRRAAVAVPAVEGDPI
jgi:drug/metabolite transporter (DMT)-like permease